MIADQKIKRADAVYFSSGETEFEGCVFTDCNFGGADLSNIQFAECIFEGCDLSSAQTGHTGFKNCGFRNSKLLGIAFDACNPFLLSFSFSGCNLSYAVFMGLKIPDTAFVSCQLTEVDFTNCVLKGARFEHSDLTAAVFDNSDLQKADFRTAQNFAIHPASNKLRGALFSPDNLTGLLTQYDLTIRY